MITKSIRCLSFSLVVALSVGCTVQRPALTKAGLPDLNKRMSITHWTLDKERPHDTIVISFAYPALTSLFHSKTLARGQRLHQYRLDDIQRSPAGTAPAKLVMTDLDTGKQVVLEHKPSRVHSPAAL